VKCETYEKGAIRSWKFGVRSPENLERRTANPCPSRWIRSTILRGHSPLVQDVQDIEVLLCRNVFSAAY